MRMRTAAATVLAALIPLAATAAPVFVPLDPRDTYLRANESPAPQAALAVDLAALGFAPGDRMLLEVVGEIDNGPGGETFTFTLGLFSSSTTMLAASLLARVPGAIASDGPAVLTSPTFFGNLATDIPEDFGFDSPLGTLVTVPAGAAYLFLAKSDILYMDNSDPDQDYGVRITRVTSEVPEPAPWVLAAAALLWLGRRGHRGHRRPA